MCSAARGLKRASDRIRAMAPDSRGNVARPTRGMRKAVRAADVLNVTVAAGKRALRSPKIFAQVSR